MVADIQAMVALGSWIAALITRYEVVCVAAAALGFAALQSARATRPLWFDELFTFHIARLPNLAQLFRAIPADGNPSLNYLLTRLSLRLLGGTAFAARAPSILAFTAALLATYYFIRRRCGPVFGMFGMLTLGCSGICVGYASQARPYALLVGFTGLTIVSWQAAAEEKRPRLIPLTGVALGIAGAIASHHYGVIHVGVPLIFGEAVRLYKRRRFDVPLYIAGVAGLLMLAVTLPFAAASHRVMLGYVRNSAAFWAKPTIEDFASYERMVSMWPLIAFLALLYLTNAAVSSSDEPYQPANEDGGPAAHEVAAAFGLALLVPIMTGVTWLTTGYYLDRYAISSAMGIAILIGFASPAMGRNKSQAIAVTALCILLLGAEPFAAAAQHLIAHRRAIAQSASLGGDAILEAAPAGEPIVVASALTYGPEWWYASPQLRQRLHYLADLPYAVRQKDFLPELSLVADQPYLPSKVDDYRQFVSTHNRFLLYSVGAPNLEWTLNRLLSEKWSLRVISTSENATLYLAEAPGK